MNLKDSDAKSNFLHGHTSTGVPLTLVGEFGTEQSGLAINHGMHYWTSAGHPFRCVIFGFHFKDDATFDAFEFDMTGAQEFFAPEVSKHYMPHHMGDVVSARSSVGEIKIFHASTFNFVSNNLRAHFHSEDNAAMDELQAAYTSVRARHPDFRPFLKKSLDYLFRFIPTSELSVLDAFPAIASITDLFSLLSSEPVRLTKLSATARDQDGKPYRMTVFPFAIDNKTTVERSLAKRNFHSLPLNNSDVDLSLLIRNWLDQPNRYESTTSMLQNMTHTVAMHETHGSIVLCATQLEDMANEAGVRLKKAKYEYGLEHHASNNLRIKLASFLDCKEDEIGGAISALRSEIAHVRKTRKYLIKLGTRRTYLVSRALQLVVIGYILEQIGVATAAREKYQDALCQSL